nr:MULTISPECIES: hypothetical protein [unclassified Mesorhizobium]
MRDAEELVVWRYPAIQILPDKLALDTYRIGIFGRLIQPRNGFLARLCWKSVSPTRGMESSDCDKSRTSLNEKFSALKAMHVVTSQLIPEQAATAYLVGCHRRTPGIGKR